MRALDLCQVLNSVSPGDHGLVSAFYSFEALYSAAKRQQRRIAQAKAALRRSRKRIGERLDGLFADVHFYLISWARMAKLADFIYRTTKFPRIKAVRQQYRTRLDMYTRFRDHIEHFEERLPRGKKQNMLAIPGDLGNMSGHCFTFGGQEVDIGPDSTRFLKRFRNDFLEALRMDAIEAVAAQDRKAATILIKMAAQRVHVSRANRYVTRILKAG